ncbi:MAG: class I adenylate-forming enzyme family protein [Jatrophihabitans sp.]
MTGVALLHELLDTTAARRPSAPAVGHGRDVLSYHQLRSASLRVASALTRLGVRRGDRVLVATPADLRLPALLFGCSRLGAVFVVMGVGTPAPVVDHVLGDAEPALVITPVAELAAAAGARGIRSLDPAELEQSAGAPDAGPAGGGPGGPVLVDPVCFVYTSGSTSMPKAVVSTHLQVSFVVGAIQSRLGYRDDDVVFCALPPSFDYGLYQLFLCVNSGAQLQLADQSVAGHRLLAALDDSGATVLAAVPSLAANLERLLARQPVELGRLRLLTNTGAAMPAGVLAALRARLPSLRVQLMYGLTECKRAAIMPPDADLDHPGACGLALPGTEIFAIDDNGARLPAGEVGEIVVRGPHVMAGYWKQPALTDQRFVAEHGLFPQLRTGDRGWRDGEGFRHFAGRDDDVYKQGGYRVSTTEVEAAAHRVPGVRVAVVVPPGPVGEAVLLVQGTLTGAEVLDALRHEIEEYKIPPRCLVVGEFPLNANGKVERRLLSELARDGTGG